MKETSLSVSSGADNLAHTCTVPSFSSTVTTGGMDTPTSAWEWRVSTHGVIVNKLSWGGSRFVHRLTTVKSKIIMKRECPIPHCPVKHCLKSNMTGM